MNIFEDEEKMIGVCAETHLCQRCFFHFLMKFHQFIFIEIPFDVVQFFLHHVTVSIQTLIVRLGDIDQIRMKLTEILLKSITIFIGYFAHFSTVELEVESRLLVFHSTEISTRMVFHLVEFSSSNAEYIKNYLPLSKQFPSRVQTNYSNQSILML